MPPDSAIGALEKATVSELSSLVLKQQFHQSKIYNKVLMVVCMNLYNIWHSIDSQLKARVRFEKSLLQRQGKQNKLAKPV